MNAQEYIESGLLELYAMGALDADEMVLVGDAVARDPRLRQELTEISRALESIAPFAGEEPSPEFRDRLMASIPQSDSPTLDTKVISLTDRTHGNETGSRRWLLAASFVGFILSAGAALWLYGELDTTREELADVRDRTSRIEQAYTSASTELEMLRDERNRVIRMARTEVAPAEAFAILYWNGANETVWIDATKMPALSNDEQYQLWAIPEDGVPVDAGIFDGKSDGLQQLKNVQTAHSFAVTVEPRGGSVTPTLETMTVLGEV